MTNRSKLYNDSKGYHGVRLQSGREYNIEPKRFISLNVDDIEYVIAENSRAFSEPHILRVEDPVVAESLGVVADEASAFDEDAIKGKLGMKVQQMKKWLDEIDDARVLDMIFDVAITMDLSASKLRALKEKMPDRQFIDAEE